MKRIFSLLTVYFLLVSQCLAVTGVPDSGHWEPAGFGGGGAFPMVVPDHFTQNKVYAIPDVNLPYVTTNKGELWSFLSTVGAVNTGYTPTQTASFVQSKNDPDLMYVLDSWGSAPQGLNRSTNGGQTWTKVRSGGTWKGSKTIAIHPDDDDIVYVSSGSSVVRSIDGGTTWATYISLPFDSRATVYTTQSSCTSAGHDWNTSLGKCTIAVRAIYVDTVNNDLWLGSKGQGMVKYDMDTDTQEYVDLTGTNAKYNVFFDTYVDGSAVENLCVTAGLKIACTADFSSWTYTAATTGTTTYYIRTFAVKRQSDGDLTFVTSRDLLSNQYSGVIQRSTDSGATWSTSSRVNNSTMNPTAAYNYGNQVFYIAADPFDEEIFYATTDARIYRSDDEGLTFNEEDTGAQMLVVTDVKVSPNGRILQVSMDTGVQYSDDFGDTWIQGTPDASKSQPFVTGSVNDYGGHYWQLELAGSYEDWEADEGKVFICATMYGTNSTLYYKNTVIRSLDSGANYTRTFSGLPTAALYGDIIWDHGYCRSMGLSADETTLYVGMDGENCDADGTGGLPYNCTTNITTGGLFVSTDDAETFTKVWSSPRKIYNALAVDPTDATNQILMFGTFGYNLYRKTGASTSNYVGDANGPGNYIYDVAYDYSGQPYAVTSNSGAAIYRSIATEYGDGSGQYGTWRLMKKFSSTGIADGLYIDPRNKKRIFVGVTLGNVTDRKIWVTVNADRHDQAKWYDITGDFPVAGGCQALTVNYFEGEKGYLYCASNGGGLWKLPLDDSPASFPGRTVLGGISLDGESQ